MSEPIKNLVKLVFSDVFELDVKEISDNISQYNFEEWDSLMHLNIIIGLEKEFRVTFEPLEIGFMLNLDIICAVIESKLLNK